MHRALAQAVVVLEEQLGAHGLLLAAQCNFAKYQVQVCTHSSIAYVLLRCGEHHWILWLVCQAQIHQKLPVVDVLIRVFQITLVFR